MFFHPQTQPSKYWDRVIILMDMDAFFAQIEQLDFPELRGQPIAVTNGYEGTTIITSSYEARRYGIKTGMRLKEASLLCSKLIRRPSRPNRYSHLSKRIMDALYYITPDIEIFSVDEAFCDVTHCQKLWGSPEKIGTMIKEKVFSVSGLSCSIGVSSDKTTAKLAAKQKKPNGLTIVPPWHAEAFLKHKPVTDLCGINHGIGRFLKNYGVKTCGDMKQLPMSILTKRFGNPGRRIWFMCQAQDPDDVLSQVPEAKSMGHSKVMPPETKDEEVLSTYLLHMCEKLTARLRRHNLQASAYRLTLLSHHTVGIQQIIKPSSPTNDGNYVYQLCHQTFKLLWKGESFYQIGLTTVAIHPRLLQEDLFITQDKRREKINKIVDEINNRFGEFAICPLRLINRSSTPNVISPSWRPEGHRQTICATTPHDETK